MNEENMEQMDQGQFFEALEDWFGCYVHDNYDEIIAAIQNSNATLEERPDAKVCPKCQGRMVDSDFEDFNDQLEEGNSLHLDMICKDCGHTELAEFVFNKFIQEK
jgi:hypothetical protein